MNDKENLVFGITALGYLGDTLLTESLCKNIKENYPNSKIVFMVNKIFEDIPKGFTSVDYVVPIDKKKLKGLKGYIDFCKNFPLKEKINYFIVTHPHERSILIGLLLKVQNIISLPLRGKLNLFNLFINKKVKYQEDEIRTTYKAFYNLKYVKDICSETTNCIPQYVISEDTGAIIQKYNLPEEYVVLSPVSKDLIKDWDMKEVKEFINSINKPVVLVGTEKASDYAKYLTEENVNFIDLTTQTSITELGAVIKNAQACVSVDTGVLHFAYAQNVKTVGLFFNEKMVKEWAPTDEKVKIILGERKFNNGDIVRIKNICAAEVVAALV